MVVCIWIWCFVLWVQLWRFCVSWCSWCICSYYIVFVYFVFILLCFVRYWSGWCVIILCLMCGMWGFRAVSSFVLQMLQILLYWSCYSFGQGYSFGCFFGWMSFPCYHCVYFRSCCRCAFAVCLLLYVTVIFHVVLHMLRVVYVDVLVDFICSCNRVM